jgi:hypothetical protein
MGPAQPGPNNRKQLFNVDRELFGLLLNGPWNFGFQNPILKGRPDRLGLNIMMKGCGMDSIFINISLRLGIHSFFSTSRVSSPIRLAFF